MADREKIIGGHLLRSQEKEDEEQNEIKALNKEQEWLTKEKQKEIEVLKKE